MPKSTKRKKINKTPSLPPPPSPPPSWWKKHWKGLLAIAGSVAAIVGFASAVATFLPRISIDIGDPIEPSNPLSAPITVTNTFIPLERVNLALGLCRIVISGITYQQYNTTNEKTDYGCTSGGPAYFTSPAMTNHRLATDDKWRVLFNDFVVGPPLPRFGGGDIRMVLKFIPWPFSYLHMDWIFGRQKEFRFKARTTANGNWQWFASTID
jgi:hypothetical protein